MNDKDRGILRKISRHISEGISYSFDMDYGTFVNDNKTMSATAFIIGQIGELAKEVSEETQKTDADIPWRAIKGMRNRIVHDYDNVDCLVLWNTIKNDLPELLLRIDNLLEMS